MIQRFNNNPVGRANTYHCFISVKTHSNNVIENETVKVHLRADRNPAHIPGAKACIHNEHLQNKLTNKILVNGPNIESFLADEMPLIFELIEFRHSLECMAHTVYMAGAQ